jgi:hypothetical protein
MSEQQLEVTSVKVRTCAEPGRACYSKDCPHPNGGQLMVGDEYARVLWEDGLIELFHSDCYVREFGRPVRRTGYSVAQLENMLAQAKAAEERRRSRKRTQP